MKWGVRVIGMLMLTISGEATASDSVIGVFSVCRCSLGYGFPVVVCSRTPGVPLLRKPISRIIPKRQKPE